MALGERRSRESPWIKKLKNYLLSPGIEPTICISRGSHIYDLSTLAQVFVGISCKYVWTTTALKDWLYFPTIKSRPVVHEKQLSASPIRISIRITPNFELVLPMIITSLLTKFHQNATSRFWEILLTNKQTNKQTNRHTKVIAISRISRDKKTFRSKLLELCKNRAKKSSPDVFTFM